MHADYKTRLATLSDKLTDVVLEEADPDNWPGAGKKPSELTKDERGDRYWDKKNAAASLTLLIAKWRLNRSRFGIAIDHDLACISDRGLASLSITIWHASPIMVWHPADHSGN